MASKISSKQTRAWIQKQNTHGVIPADWTDPTKVMLLHQTGYDGTVKREKKEDQANLGGGGFPSGMITVKETADAKLPVSLHPEQFAKLAYYSLGSVNSAVDVPTAFVYIIYTGTAQSALLKLVGTNLTASIGALGSESADVTFGTAGTISLSDTATDTISELCAVISGYANYKAFYIGDGTKLSTTLPTFTDNQIKNVGIFLKNSGVSSTEKTHHIIPAYTKPTFSIIADRILEVEQLVDGKADGFSMKLTESDLISMEMTISGREIISGVSLPTVTTKEPTQQMQGAKAKCWINGVLQPGITSLSLSSSNNLLKVGEIGQFGISEPSGQTPAFDIDLETYFTTETQHLKTKYLADDNISIIFEIESVDNVKTGIPYRIIGFFPTCGIMELSAPIGSGDSVIQMPTKLKVLESEFVNISNPSPVNIFASSKLTDITLGS